MSEKAITINHVKRKTKDKQDDTILFFAILFFFCLYFLRDIGGVSVSKYLFTLFCAVAFLLMSVENAFAFYILTLPLTLPSNQIIAVYIIIIVFKLLTSRKVNLDISNLAIVVIMIMIQIVDQALFGKSGFASSAYLFVQILMFLLVPLLWEALKFDSATVQRAMICFVIGFLIGSFVVLFNTAKEIGFNSLFLGGYRLSLDNLEQSTVNNGMVTVYNANHLASLASLSVAFVLVLLSLKRIHVSISLAIICYSVLICLMTLSRTGVVTLVFIASFFVIFWHAKKKAKNRKIAIVLFLGICVFICFTMFPQILESVFSRFEVDDITNGRLSINSAYIEEWSKSIWSVLFGYGSISYLDVTSVVNSPHNMIVDILISWGITGLILVGIWLVKNLIKNFRLVDKKSGLLSLLPFATYLLALQAGQFLTVISAYLLLNFTIIAVRGAMTQNELFAK